MPPIRIAHVTTVDLTLRFLLMGQLRSLRDAGFDVTGISAPGPWVGDLATEGIRHIPWLHATRSWSPREDMQAFIELLRILRRERFDLVHTHNPKPGVMGRPAARLAGVPFVANTVHGLYAMPTDRLVKRSVVLSAEWLAARFSDLELYQSEEDMAWAIERRVTSRSKARFLGNGTDLASFDPIAIPIQRKMSLRQELGIAEDDLVVGMVGRLVLEKGYREYFAAARGVREVMPEARFIAVGDVDRDKVDAISDELLERFKQDVLVTGWREDVPDLLSIMDVFVLPSYREGVPRSAIEAAALGVPLVLTDIRGCREVVRDGVEGILVPARDAGALACAILRLLRDRELRSSMGAAARVRAEERFDERRVREIIVDATRSLLDGHRLPEPEAGLSVRAARPSDAGKIAALHREALPEAFLPTLGEGFLVQVYRTLTQDPSAVACVATEGSEVVGFAASVPSVRRFYRRFLVRRGFIALVVAAPRLLQRTVRRRLSETMRHPRSTHDLPDAELLAIAVSPSHRSKGVGEALVGELIRGLAEQGVIDAKVVVAVDNQGANRFYQRVGFHHVAVVALHDRRPSNVWVIRCRSSSPSLSASS